MAAPSYVYDLLASEAHARWGASTPLGTPVTITYNFATAEPAGLIYPNYQPFNVAEVAATEKALAYISSFTNITFVKSTSSPQLQFGNADISSEGSGVSGVAHYHYNGDGITDANVTISNTGGSNLTNSDFTPAEIDSRDIGGAGWQTLLHEIGHTLGLKHPFQTNADNDPDSLMPASLDNFSNTIMSYTPYQPSNVAVVTGNASGYSYTSSALKPSTYSLFDIAALQYLYGTGPASAGGKVFAFAPETPVMMTITDNGPNDTIDCSALTGANVIDMNAGASSDLAIRQHFDFNINLSNAYNGSHALTIAYGVNVQNCIGGSGADKITGNQIGNLLDGGAGADTLAGGAGNDTYVLDGTKDVIQESGGGHDLVRSVHSFSLAGQSLEDLTLIGTYAVNATGNSLANHLIGNAKANILNGGTAADTMEGGAGNDTYVVDNAKDVVKEAGGGVDLVQSSVSFTLAGQPLENLTLTGSGAIKATGNSYANVVTGNSGANTIDGMTGADTLAGGAGKDIFVFDTALGSTNVDKVTDFSVADDTIRLDNSVFGNLATGTLATAAFWIGAAAHDGSDRIVYNSANGQLLYDDDGSGVHAAKVFATLSAGLALTHLDFTVVA